MLHPPGFILIIACYVLLPQSINSALTEEQMQQAAGMLRKMCQPRFPVEDALVDGINRGEFPDDHNLMCYVNCVMELMQLSRRGVINYEASLKQINTLLPENIRNIFTRTLDLCRDAMRDTNTEDRCTASYMAMQCFQQNNPMFIFP